MSNDPPDTFRPPDRKNRPIQAPRAHLPLPVMIGGGNFVIVEIPKMTDEGFEFFIEQLSIYRESIIARLEDITP